MPNHLNQENYRDSVDNPENRFIKYFLYLLQELVEEMVVYVDKKNNAGGYPADKIRKYQEIIQEYVSDGWLQDVGDMNYFPSNSQVLQKKEGYREILNYFLIFEFSFNFQFEEVTDDIKGYQKKLSELYEYWCYLKMLDILSKMAQVPVDYSSIFNLNKKWNIEIKRGTESKHKFDIKIGDQDLELYMEFNSEFKKSNPDYHSYSLNFRPDYTITVKNGLEIFFLHFDAKYKSNEDKVKNEDVYKMHTYKDALKETRGAYVLYPGKKDKIYQESDEDVVPSVGAFTLTPGGIDGKDMFKIEFFLIQVLKDYIIVKNKASDFYNL